ncbi:MAG TPA: PspC domain-containing protein [Patescibacteria group bacterium]
MAEMIRKLERKPEEGIIAGVAAGIADYLQIDPTLVRIIFVLMSFGGGGGVIFYVILWLAMPKTGSEKETSVKEFADEIRDKAETAANELRITKSKHSKGNNGNFFGVILILLGVIWLWNQIMPMTIKWDWLWPIVLIIAGVMMIFK